MNPPERLEPTLYRQRFSPEELAAHRQLWIPICRYIERWMQSEGIVLDLGAGYCTFINEVKARRKYAYDVNEEALRKYAAPGVELLVEAGSGLRKSLTEPVDTVFASNVYEHFHTREEVAASFRDVWTILKSGGRFIILQPNFSYCARHYFDFFDHRLAFTDKGMVEGVELAGFQIVKCIPRFLPYSSKSALPKASWLVSLYLHFPLVWHILGRQMLIVAEKVASSK